MGAQPQFLTRSSSVAFNWPFIKFPLDRRPFLVPTPSSCILHHSSFLTSSLHGRSSPLTCISVVLCYETIESTRGPHSFGPFLFKTNHENFLTRFNSLTHISHHLSERSTRIMKAFGFVAALAASLASTAIAEPTRASENLAPRQASSGSLPVISSKGNGLLHV